MSVRGARLAPLGVLLLLALPGVGAGCAPAELRIPPPDGAAAPEPADGAAPADGATPEVRPRRCFPRPSNSGPNQPGELCTMPTECQHAPDEIALCTSRDPADSQAKILRCHRLTRAGLGQPCTITLTRNGQLEGMTSTLGGGTVPDTTAFCDLRDGLVCDLGDHQCHPLPELGDSCATRPYCPRGSFCDADRCSPGLPVGRHCQGVLDFDEQTQCTLGAHCDIGTDTCVPAAADGEKCDYFAQCTSGVCIDGTCVNEGNCPR